MLFVVPDYDITHPVQVDENGEFLSHDSSHGNSRRKREIGSPIKEPLFIKLSAFGQDYHINVTLNDQLFSPNFVIEVRNNRTSRISFEVDNCHYVGQLMSTKGQAAKVAVSNCDGLVRETVGVICACSFVLLFIPLFRHT